MLEFFDKVELFEWEETDKQEFIREMLGLDQETREEILNEMIGARSKYKKENIEFKGR